MSSRWRVVGGLRAHLLAAHLLVVLVGVAVLLVGIRLAAPGFLRQHMAGGGRGVGPMAMMGRVPPEVEAALSDAFTAALGDALLVASAAALVVAVVASVLVSERVLAPVRSLAAASRRIAAGHYAERVPGERTDELGALAVSFNEMAAALEDGERRRLAMIGDVAHELRTPIATVEGYAEGLLDGVVPASDETWAKIHTEARRLRRLVDDLQELSRAEARQLSLRLEPVDPGEVVGAAVERLAGDFAAAGLDLVTDLPASLPAAEADPERVLQVLTNLLTNALRYTPSPGRVTISAEPVGRTVRFRVTDTGVGIAAEHLPRLFERFYRVDPARSRTLGGSGIGLTVARALVEAMGGRIWAESPGPGRGSTFAFDLPRIRRT